MNVNPLAFGRKGPNVRPFEHGNNVGTSPYVDSPHHGPNRRNRKNQPYFSDKLVVSRVKKYLEENAHDVTVDFEHMVEYFQASFREYSNRKRNALKGLLHRAHEDVMEEFRANLAYTNKLPPLLGTGTGTSVSSEDYADDDEEMRDSFNESGRQSNMQLMSLYGSTKKQARPRNPDEEEELINISSSDEGSNEVKKPKQAAKNEPKPIPPLIPPALSVIKKAETEIFPSVPYNGGQNHSTPVKPLLLPGLSTTISLDLSNRSGTPINDKSRKRKAVDMTDTRKPATGPTKKKREVPVVDSKVTFKDFGGNAKVLTEVCKLLVHMRHPEVYRRIGVSPPRGFLLHGPPGCGKTLLAQAIAGELQVPLIKVASPELVAGVSGESEERVRELFAQAVGEAPCVLFLDEVDAITPNRHTAQREMERRIVAQLLSSLDELGQQENGDQVLVIGATNRPDAIDPALRRAGRFDREVCLGIPDLDARRQILKVLCGKLRLADDLSFDDIARNTPGYVGADLMALTREAAMAAVNRVFGELKNAAKKAKLPIEVVDQVVKPAETSKEDVILVQDEPKAKEKPDDNEDKDVVVDDDDSEKVAGNATEDKRKEDSKMEVCEDATDNSDCVVLDVTPKEKELDKVVTTVVDVGPKETAEQNVPMETEVKAVERPVSATEEEDSAFGPDLTELISWLHDVVPLTPAQLEMLHVEKKDFELALKAVQPSAKREGFATVPDVTWDDVGALTDIRDELQMAILAPVKHAKQFAALGLTTPTGVLLCGPPGCGKTFLAKAVANEAGINFISVKGPELLNMYVGESERAVRQCFQRARNSAPCVIFFDELDALCPKRSDSGEGGASMRVVNQMLTEMDGVEGRKDVYLMAATNRPDIVDPAVLRPGRLDKILYVGMPTGPDRALILQALTKKGTKPTLSADVSLSELGECCQTNGYTGADLAALVREAGIQALREYLTVPDNSAPLAVSYCHFTKALAKIRPSVSEKDRKYYEKLREIYTAVPSSNSGL